MAKNEDNSVHMQDGEVDMDVIPWYKRPWLGLIRNPRFVDLEKGPNFWQSLSTKLMALWQVAFGRPVIYRVEITWPLPILDDVNDNRGYPVSVLDCTLVGTFPRVQQQTNAPHLTAEDLERFRSWN